MPSAIVSDKTSPVFPPCAGVLRLWFYALNKMAKSRPTCTTDLSSEIILHLTKESLEAKRLKSSCLSKGGLGKDSGSNGG